MELFQSKGTGKSIPDGCGACDAGFTIPFVDTRRMNERERVEGQVHCACDLGQYEREDDIAKWNDFVRWARETDEKQARNRNKMYDRIGIPGRFKGYTLAGYAALAGIEPNKQKAMNLAEEFARNGFAMDRDVQKKSIYLFGPRGIGKTGLLVPVFMELARSGLDCMFAHYLTFMRLIRQGYQDGDANEKIDRAIDVDVLFIDDLGQSRRSDMETDHSRMVVQDIIYYRHGDDKETLITSNLTPPELKTQFSEETWQRVAEMSVVCPMNGKILRDIDGSEDVSF